MDTNGIKEVLQFYFDGSFEGSGEKMERAFHDAAHIYGRSEDGKLTDMPKDAFVRLVGSGPRDRPPYPREDEIVSIDFTGENTAIARVKLRVHNTRFTDMLCFMQLDGRWGIIAKVYSGVMVES